jgi:hypothetical protein
MMSRLPDAETEKLPEKLVTRAPLAEWRRVALNVPGRSAATARSCGMCDELQSALADHGARRGELGLAEYEIRVAG